LVVAAIGHLMTMERTKCAEVIPFPHHLSSRIDAAARLGRAVRALDQANAELRDNVLVLRCSTDALIVSLSEITESLRVLDAELTKVSSQLCIQHEEPDENGRSYIISANARLPE
jgi:hypothetical protein